MSLKEQILDRYENALENAFKNKHRYERLHDKIRELEMQVTNLKQVIAMQKGEICILQEKLNSNQ